MIKKLAITLVCLLSIYFIKTAYSQEPCNNLYGSASLPGTCGNINNCTGAALIGNCTSLGDICCILDDPPASLNEHPKLTKNIFLKLVDNTTRNNLIYYHIVESIRLASLSGEMEEFKISAFLAQIIDETNYFRKLESGIIEINDTEDEGYSDSQKYQARGGIQISGIENYILANLSRLSYNIRFNLVQNPERAAFPSVAFKIAAWFWKENAYVIDTYLYAKKGDLNRLVDGTFVNFTQLTYSLTNNLRNLKERTMINAQVLTLLNSGLIQRGEGLQCLISGQMAYAVPLCLRSTTNDYKTPYCGCDGDFEIGPCPYGTTSKGNCRSSPIIKCCLERLPTLFDVVFAIDSSSSVGLQNFLKTKGVVKNLLEKLNLGLDGTRVSLVTFNTNSTIGLDFKNFRDLPSTLNALDELRYSFGSTNLASAFMLINDYILQEGQGMRPTESSIPKLIALITDGRSDNKNNTLREAERIRVRGFNIIPISISDRADELELLSLASSPYHVFSLTRDSLDSILLTMQRVGYRQNAQISFDKELRYRVTRNSYKFFQLEINRASPNTNVSIELISLSGNAQLFYSFTEKNPKSPVDFIDIASTDGMKDENFVDDKEPIIESTTAEPGSSATSTTAGSPALKTLRNSNLIEIPPNVLNATLYISVKGINQINDFQIYAFYGTRTLIPNTCSKFGFTVWNSLLTFLAIFYFLRNFF